MASGLPVVTTSVGAIGEQVEHGVTGFLVPPGDHDALAEAMLRLVADPDLRREMGAAGRRAADRLFNGARNYPRCPGGVQELRRRRLTSMPGATLVVVLGDGQGIVGMVDVHDRCEALAAWLRSTSVPGREHSGAPTSRTVAGS